MSWRQHDRARDDAGSAVGLMWAIGIALAGIVATLTLVVAAIVAQRHASQAADATAVSAVAAALHGDDACHAAERIARANRATLASCEVLGSHDVIVEVTVPVGLTLPGLPDIARAQARAQAG